MMYETKDKVMVMSLFQSLAVNSPKLQKETRSTISVLYYLLAICITEIQQPHSVTPTSVTILY